ncbi:amidohydrolase family protein [Adhaeribacter radiodurans]|uniref:Amidohydrolase family protein n=1 Tax=Adhaeribacter radiodurans TaxID=2745197 RepID=A0A7L7L5L6_9BACT|nr:amidohydrolase family protein [Adhaeribacter radiodurans]QMU28097.1 amidohydrolase family protein [Adhaeribacter radiodurans]
MNKGLFLLLAFSLFSVRTTLAQNPDKLLLKDYRPKSIYKIPITAVPKAKFPVIDLHSHPYPKSDAELADWVKTMDEVGIDKTVILSYSTGAKFDSIQKQYSKYGKRFEVWCGFDFTGKDKPGWIKKAVKELERCYKAGARGVGELGDKGLGEFYSLPTAGYGLHIDDARMKPLLQKCAELKMPISIHVAEPYWMYEPMDSTNDGLMNAYQWKIDKTKPGLLGHAALIKTLENAVRDNPKTTFIACHFANSEYDLSILGNLFDKYPNLYADIAARYGETSPIPRYMNSFFKKYQDRLVYGTDMGTSAKMYSTTFRILETLDEHFYEFDQFGYHWYLNGFGLDDETLRKVYRDNALKILMK